MTHKKPACAKIKNSMKQHFTEVRDVQSMRRIKLLSSSDRHPLTFSLTVYLAFFLACILTFFLAFYLAYVLTSYLAVLL